MDSYDHYAEAKKIAAQLDAQGFSSEAENIRNAISEGRSGTEIFMQLRFYLTPISNAENLTDDIKWQITVLLNKINEALSR